MKNLGFFAGQQTPLPFIIGGKRAACPTIIFTLVGLLLSPEQAYACAACFGKSDSPAAWAMNMAIFTLLVVIVGVLSCCAAFIFYLRKRSIASFAQSQVGL